MTKQKQTKKDRQGDTFRSFSVRLLRIMQFWRRHRIAAILSGMIAVLGSLTSIYALSEPDMVAFPTAEEFSGELQMVPDGGFTIWMVFEQRFKNDSWRGGGYITGFQIIPKTPESASWFTNKIVAHNSEPFGPFEKKTVMTNALFQFPELPIEKTYPQFEVDVQFLDQNGAVIRELGSNDPYSFSFTIEDSVFNSLKGFTEPSR